MTKQTMFPAHDAIAGLLEKVLPGRSRRAQTLRRQVLSFCANLSAKTLLLRGPIGSGKSTLARAIGFLRRTVPLSQPEAALWVDQKIRYDGLGRVDFRLMDWYVELSLTGLSEELAGAQLFGVAKKAATGVDERAGLFELATTGRSGDKSDPTVGAKVTGGIVFLDEIGDLTLTLQGKLLPVLSGGVFYRIGGEANPVYEQQFRGITIAASWRRLDDGVLRADLLSRIMTHVIDVPDLSEREEDLPLLIEGLQHDLIARHSADLDELCRSDPKVDRDYWSKQGEAVRPLSDADMKLLMSVDWSRYGNLRGLADAIERILVGRDDTKRVIHELQPVEEMATDSSDPRTLLSRLMYRKPDGTGLASHVREIQREEQRALRDVLQVDATARATIARALGVDESRLVYQVHQLGRSRRGRRGGTT